MSPSPRRRIDRVVDQHRVRLLDVAAGAAQDSGVAGDLLGDFLVEAAAAISSGRRLSARRVAEYERQGRRAAEEGVDLSALVDLYLSASWRLWREIPHLNVEASAGTSPAPLLDAGEGMLRTTDDVVASVAAGYQKASVALLAKSAAARREFVDDLLGGGGDPAELADRSLAYGLRLSGRHRVAVLRRPGHRLDETNILLGYAADACRGLAGRPAFLTTSKDGNLIIVIEGPDDTSRRAVEQVALSLRRTAPDLRLGVGRSRTGAGGPTRSYGEALDCLRLGERFPVGPEGAYADDLLVYLSLARDTALLEDLVAGVLLPLTELRGGASGGLETLRAYLDNRGSATATAHQLHLSVRGLTYRMTRIQGLLREDLDDGQQRLTVELAVFAATLLDWPDRPLPAHSL